MTALPLQFRTAVRRFITNDGPAVVVPVPRIVCTLAVGSRRRLMDGWIDTGSPLTIFPLDMWEPFADQISWAGAPDAVFPVSVGGAVVPVRFGRVRVGVVSADLRAELAAVDVSAMFAQGPSPNRVPLIGLWGGVLAGRRLVVEPDLASARLEAA